MAHFDLVIGGPSAKSSRARRSPSPTHPKPDSIRRLQRSVGNHAVTRLLAAGRIQPHLKTSQPGEDSEREADRPAEDVVQRKSLQDAEAQGKAGSAAAAPGAPVDAVDLRGQPRGGLTREPNVRSAGATSFGAGFSSFLTHNHGASGRLSSGLDAGGDQPSSPAVDGLPAREVTHDVQPGSALKWESPPAASLPLQGQADAGGSLILDDGAATVASGQMRRADFLEALEQAVSGVADDRLSAVGRTAKDCPYLRYMFRFYAAKDVGQLRRAILRHAPETGRAATAGEYIALVSQRVRNAVDTWVATGRIEWRAHGMEAPDDPALVQAELGPGRALDGGIRAKAESAMQEDLSGVRVHTGEGAASMSSRFGARAFTVGRDVAFAAGEYQPGTPVGDAIIAHELAHVVQQKESRSAASQEGGTPDLERDADQAAGGTVMAIWGAAKGAVAGVARKVKPALRTGLRLQSCPSKEKGPLQFFLNRFTMDADGPLQTDSRDMMVFDGDLADKGFRPGKVLLVATKEITSSATAVAKGGTDLEASAWQAGYLQTTFNVKMAATYKKRRGTATPTGRPRAAAEEKVFLAEAPDHTRDCVTNHVVDEPWYNDRGYAIRRFDGTEQSRTAQLSDRPNFFQPAQTDDGYDLSKISGQHKFGTWFIVAPAAGGTPYFLKSATWEVNWAMSVTVDAAGIPTPTPAPDSGSKKTNDPVSESGPRGPQLNGRVTNDAIVRRWKTP